MKCCFFSLLKFAGLVYARSVAAQIVAHMAAVAVAQGRGTRCSLQCGRELSNRAGRWFGFRTVEARAVASRRGECALVSAAAGGGRSCCSCCINRASRCPSRLLHLPPLGCRASRQRASLCENTPTATNSASGTTHKRNKARRHAQARRFIPIVVPCADSVPIVVPMRRVVRASSLSRRCHLFLLTSSYAPSI